MKPSCRATTQDDEARLIAFIARVFAAPRDANFLRPAFMRWKYWVPREDYGGPRSYVLERGGVIVAHAGLWPVTLKTRTETAHGVHLMDWVSDPHSPGAGAGLIKRLLEMFDFMYAIGGAVATRKVLPALGFQQVLDFWGGARPLRPLRQILAHQSVNWKLPARLARNILWRLTPRAAGVKGWTITDADLNAENGGTIPGGSFDRVGHPNAFFRYLQKCPGVDVGVFELLKDGRKEGRIALSVVCRQARLLGVWLEAPSPERLRTAYVLAQQAALRTGGALEFKAGGCSAAGEQAAVAAGIRTRKRDPVYLLRRNGALPPIPFEFQMADSNDLGFFGEGRPDFLT